MSENNEKFSFWESVKSVVAQVVGLVILAAPVALMANWFLGAVHDLEHASAYSWAGLGLLAATLLVAWNSVRNGVSSVLDLDSIKDSLVKSVMLSVVGLVLLWVVNHVDLVSGPGTFSAL